MYFQFLIEDTSSAALVEILMGKLCQSRQDVAYRCKPFKGIGGLTRKNTVKETKTGKLLNDLATYLKGFNKHYQGMEAAVFILVDNDDRNTEDFRHELESVADQNNITIDHVFCIAIEEIEAWLLGDPDAVRLAYPGARLHPLHAYRQDSICGTWEILADAVYQGGLKMFLRDCPTYIEKGKHKYEWAKTIGQYMQIEKNRSPSFQSFIQEIYKRMPS